MPSLESEAARIFLEAVEEHERGQRADFVRGASSGDPQLLNRVNVLLKAHDESHPMLHPGQLLANSNHAEPGDRPGTMIGQYKLLEQIGEGGMGVVYLAEQQQPVRRKVALKVIKPGMDTRQVIARFEAERQALAMMNHPNIAKVFDGGTTGEPGASATGDLLPGLTGGLNGGLDARRTPVADAPGSPCRPYFVMELVKGLPITDFCDQQRLGTRERLRLFITVCQAVQHAHQKGLIHRDLKPSNLLVEMHDVTPVPKVIDFGVSKAIGQQLTDMTLHTGFTQMVGTPLYMSPEQAGQSSLDVDTRSDVYSLGVLLYEMLTGHTPFESETLRKAGYDEMRRMIREVDPPRPSARVSTLQAKALSTISDCRSVEPGKFSQTLRGELDWIVMKALEKDRSRRYETASALAADVQRYLNDESVEACPPSPGYRLRKYARRNRRLLASAAVIAMVLVVTTSVSTWLAVEARAARRLADERLDNEKKAQKEAATDAAIARAVNDFLQVDLLGTVDGVPQFRDESGGNPDLTVKEALDRASARIGDRFRDQPLVEAAIRMAIGTAYTTLNRHEFAVPHLESALALRRIHLGPNYADTVECMLSLAAAYSWAGRPSDAITLCQQVVEYREARFGPDHTDTLTSEIAHAESYCFAGRYAEGVPLLEQVLERQRAIWGPTHPLTLNTMHILARSYDGAGRLHESLDLYQKALGGCTSIHATAAGYLRNFARACHHAGQLDRADQLLREALEEVQKDDDSLGRRNAEANTLGLLATNRLLQANYEEAESFARAAVAMNQKEEYRHFEWVGVLGAILVARQKYEEAEPILLRAYEGMKRREALASFGEQRRLAEAGERIVRFYEATKQPEMARTWREKLSHK